MKLKEARKNIQQTHIDFYRPVCHKEVLDDVQKVILQQNKTKKKSRDEKPERRQALFLNQFRMFVGRERELLQQANDDPYNFFTCNTKWPVCRINYTRPH